MRTLTRLFLGMVVGLVGLPSAMAALIPNAISGVTGIPYHVGDSGTFNADGNVQRVFNGGGLNVGNVADPATWTHISDWQNGWQSNNTTTTGSLVADLGSIYTTLDKIYIWNVTESGAVARGTKTIDIYYATNPTVTPTIGTTTNFASGGWTLLSSNVNVTIGTNSGASPYNALVDLTSVPAARYIGFRLIDNQGSTSPARIGLAEVQFTTTAIPEPTTWALGVCGLLALAYSRRRRASF